MKEVPKWGDSDGAKSHTLSKKHFLALKKRSPLPWNSHLSLRHDVDGFDVFCILSDFKHALHLRNLNPVNNQFCTTSSSTTISSTTISSTTNSSTASPSTTRSSTTSCVTTRWPENRLFQNQTRSTDLFNQSDKAIPNSSELGFPLTWSLDYWPSKS